MSKLLRALGVLALVLVTIGGVVLIKPWASASTTASASASAGKTGPSETLADAVKLKGHSADAKVTAVGTLVANESVQIASEIPRRVVKINFEDGARVKKGDTLFELDSAELLAQSSELSVRRKLLVINEGRQKKLVAEGLAPQAEYDRAKSELDLLDAQAGSLSVSISRTKIKAPFDGRLGLRNVSIGAMVSVGAPLVTLQDVSRVKVDFTVPERYASLVKLDSKFSFRVEGTMSTFAGTVIATEPQVDLGTRSLRVRGLADASPEVLVPGGFVTVDLVISTTAGALFIPAEAVIPSLGGHGVYRMEDGVAKLVDVELGVRTEREIQITKGLAEGDVVLTTNLLRLRPGAKVKLGKVSEGKVAE